MVIAREDFSPDLHTLVLTLDWIDVCKRKQVTRLHRDTVELIIALISALCVNYMLASLVQGIFKAKYHF